MSKCLQDLFLKLPHRHERTVKTTCMTRISISLVAQALSIIIRIQLALSTLRAKQTAMIPIRKKTLSICAYFSFEFEEIVFSKEFFEDWCEEVVEDGFGHCQCVRGHALGISATKG